MCCQAGRLGADGSVLGGHRPDCGRPRRSRAAGQSAAAGESCWGGSGVFLLLWGEGLLLHLTSLGDIHKRTQDGWTCVTVVEKRWRAEWTVVGHLAELRGGPQMAPRCKTGKWFGFDGLSCWVNSNSILKSQFDNNYLSHTHTSFFQMKCCFFALKF